MKYLLKDTRGKQSITLTLVVPACLLIMAKYAISGMAFGVYGIQPPMTAIEFGTGFMLVLAPFLQREWTEKVSTT